MIPALIPFDAVPISELRRALVIKLGHHGDVLLSSPVISCLRGQNAQLQIDALVYADTAPMLALHPDLSDLHCVDRNWKQLGWWQRMCQERDLLHKLQARQFDLIVHLGVQWRGVHVVRRCKPRFSVAPVQAQRGRLWRKTFTHLVNQPRSDKRHEVESNLDALRRIGIQPPPKQRKLVLRSDQQSEQKVKQLLAQHNLQPGSFIHIHPVSRWMFKCLPSLTIAELINSLQSSGLPVVLSAAPDDAELEMIAEIQQQLKTPAISLAGQLSLKELAALTAQAKLFIGVDSAPMHIAAAMQTPVVAVFGPSGEAHWAPWMVEQRLVTSKVHRCRPCGIDGCGGGKISECLTSIPAASLLSACQELLSQTNKNGNA